VTAQQTLYEFALQKLPSNVPMVFQVLSGARDPNASFSAFLSLHETINRFSDTCDHNFRSRAWFLLGAFHEVGCGTAKDITKAVSCYVKAASLDLKCEKKHQTGSQSKPKEAGDIRAHTMVAFHLMNGTNGMKGDAVSVEQLLERAAKGGEPRAMRELGKLLLKRNPNDQKETVSSAQHWLNEATERGDVEAMLVLAKHYVRIGDYGSCVAELYARAAKAGSLVAQNALGVCYETGMGVPQDESLAAAWYARSARSGFPPALCNVGALSWRAGCKRKAVDSILRGVHAGIYLPFNLYQFQR
jgi:TPR repeat protein